MGLMNAKEVYTKLSQHQLEGVMFHQAMEQWFLAAGCPDLQKLHARQAVEEFKNCLLTENDYALNNKALLQVTPTSYRPDFIKPEWYEALPKDSNPTAYEGMEKWLEWEKTTLALYTKLYIACEPDSQDALYIEMLIKGVKQELSYIYGYLAKHV